MSINNDLEYLARGVKQAYTARRAALTKSPYKLPAKLVAAEFWQIAAQACVDLKVSPDELVAAAFSECKLAQGPYPNHIGSSAIYRWVEAVKLRNLKTPVSAGSENADYGDEAQDAAHAMRWTAQLLTAKCSREMTTETRESAYYDTLDNPLMNIPAFARAILAYPIRMDIVFRWLDATQTFLRQHPKATAALNSLWPMTQDLLALKKTQNNRDDEFDY